MAVVMQISADIFSFAHPQLRMLRAYGVWKWSGYNIIVSRWCLEQRTGYFGLTCDRYRPTMRKGTASVLLVL